MKNKGITLIALVITVIVLLILAGISISMLAGDNSILQRAVESKEATDLNQKKEGITLAYNSALVAGQGSITEDLFSDELTKEFGTRNEKYTLINSKDGKSWIVSIKGTNLKETIAKPINLQTNPINPEEKYGYKDSSGIIDAKDLKEGDLINYYCDNVEKSKIPCAVLFNDDTHGLQVVALDSVKDVILGFINDTNQDPKALQAFENEAPSGYTLSNLDNEFNRWSYNHAFQSLKEYAMDYVGDMSINARCVGAPESTILLDNKETNMYKVDEDYEWLSIYDQKFKNKDDLYLSEEIEKMKSLGIMKTTNSNTFWITSRQINTVTWSGRPDAKGLSFSICYANSNGEIIKDKYLCLFAAINGTTLTHRSYVGGKHGLRPIFQLRDDIQIEKTGHLN